MIDVEAERVRFEAVAIRAWNYGIFDLSRDAHGEYRRVRTRSAFNGWLAAKRDALSAGTIPAEQANNRRNVTFTDEE